MYALLFIALRPFSAEKLLIASCKWCFSLGLCHFQLYPFGGMYGMRDFVSDRIIGRKDRSDRRLFCPEDFLVSQALDRGERREM